MGISHFLVCPSKKAILLLGKLLHDNGRLRFQGGGHGPGRMMPTDEFCEAISLFLMMHEGEQMFLASDKESGPWDEERWTWYEYSAEMRKLYDDDPP